MSLLEVKGLRVIYRIGNRYVEALSGIDLEVRRGETLGLVGESDSGKSTLGLSIMRILPQNARITSGEIIFEGINLLKCSEKEIRSIRGRKISMVFQDPLSSLNPVERIIDHFIELYKSHIATISREEIVRKSR
jgi:peptide/nickel transport system ATP-binding protein